MTDLEKEVRMLAKKYLEVLMALKKVEERLDVYNTLENRLYGYQLDKDGYIKDVMLIDSIGSVNFPDLKKGYYKFSINGVTIDEERKRIMEDME